VGVAGSGSLVTGAGRDNVGSLLVTDTANDARRRIGRLGKLIYVCIHNGINRIRLPSTACPSTIPVKLSERNGTM